MGTYSPSPRFLGTNWFPPAYELANKIEIIGSPDRLVIILIDGLMGTWSFGKPYVFPDNGVKNSGAKLLLGILHDLSKEHSMLRKGNQHARDDDIFVDFLDPFYNCQQLLDAQHTVVANVYRNQNLLGHVESRIEQCA